MKRVLVAGASGYLGKYLVRELQKRDFHVRVLIRDVDQKILFTDIDDYFIGNVTQPETIQNVTQDIDYVFSTIGITRQKDGLTYMEVDYMGNHNLLNEAIKSGTSHFLYVSAINGDNMRNLKIFEAKEKFVDELINSGLGYTIMRPNGFFSDMRDFLNMAKGGKVFLFGDGNYQLNPIDGKDLAKVCVDSLLAGEKEVIAGGPDLLSQNQIAELALEAWSNDPNIIHLPNWMRKFTIWLLRTTTSSKTYGPVEFFLTAMSIDNIAAPFGTRRLADFFNNEVKSQTKNE